MSKRERIARLTADLIERQGQYSARINALSARKREILSEVRGLLSPDPNGSRPPKSQSTVQTNLARPGGNGAWSLITADPHLTVRVDTAFES